MKPWNACDDILCVLTESAQFDFENDPDAFLTINDLFEFSSVLNVTNPLQRNFIPLPTHKRELPNFDEIMDKMDNHTAELIQKVALVEKQQLTLFNSIKVESPSDCSRSISSVESEQNGSAIKINYNLRSQSKQGDQSSSKKRKSLAEESEESENSSTDEEDDMTFETSDSDVDETSRTIRSSCSKSVNSSNNSTNHSSKSNSEKKRRKRTTYNKEHTEVLKNFLLTHSDYPYPTESEKQELLRQIDYSMSKEQLETWFVNHRKRYLPNLNRSRTFYSAPSKSGFDSELEKKLKQEKKKK